MKTKEPKPTSFLFYRTILFVLVVIFVGCLTAKKASKQQDKIIEKFPSIAAGKLRARFPIIERETITTVIDSSEFIESRNKIIAEAERQRRYTDSLWRTLSNNPVAKEVCKDIMLINDALILENKTLNRLIANQKPITVYKEKVITQKDSSEIYQLTIDRDEWKQLYAIDHDWRVLKEKKEKGKLVILIPRWILILLLLAGAGFIFLGLKNKTFNLVKLATKTISYVSKKRNKETDSPQ